MGNRPSTGPMAAQTIRRFFDPKDTFKVGRLHMKPEGGEEPGCDALAAYCILDDVPSRVAAADAVLQQARAQTAAAKAKEVDAALRAVDRSLGCILGNTVGDALGAPLEFSDVRYGSAELKGLCHDEVWGKAGYNSFSLKPGQWTDDSSMGHCIMDSLLCCGEFNAYDLRQRFHGWNSYGYNNAFGRDTERVGCGSVGLGGNISMSMSEWQEKGTARTGAGDRFTSGNGSVMRNGAIPVWFRNDVNAGMAAAESQSRTTHGGDEAAELCRLLTFICTNFINGRGRELLDDLSSFSSESYAVMCLASARCEEAHAQNAAPVFGGLECRKWDWKSPHHQYCIQRAASQPGYIGSYAMDAVSMALHCVYTTTSFSEATLKAANLRGDSDSVCAVVGQIAGALYGASAIPEDWLERVWRWDGGTIAARALMLHNHESLPCRGLTDAACESALLLGKQHLTTPLHPFGSCTQHSRSFSPVPTPSTASTRAHDEHEDELV